MILTFFLLSLLVLFLDQWTDGWTTMHLFCVYRSSLKDPLFYIRLLGHVLGHANYSHYMGNMMLLLVVGPPLEERYGSSRLLGCMFITALTSGLVQFFLFPGTALLGASGIVFMLIMLASLAGMKDGAFIVDTARGDLVASAAFAKALCSGKIAGAGLDTIAPEPVTTENPLLSLPHDRRGDPGGAKRTAAGKYRERVIIKSKTKTPLQLKWKSCEGVCACTATAHMGGCYCLFLAGGSGFMASSAVPSSFG